MKPPSDRKGALLARPGYEVGYAKPPEATRFRKGQSGNPRGRPKGTKNELPRLNEERMKTIILQEAYRTITVREGERNITVPIAQAVLRSLAVNAVKGQHRSQRLFAELLAATETANKALSDEWLNTAMDYKIKWDQELDRRRRFGIKDLPDPLPHPDHVIIDLRDGTAHVRGPATKEEKAEHDMWLGRKRAFQAELEDLQQDWEAEDDPKMRSILEIEIGQTVKVIEFIARALPD